LNLQSLLTLIINIDFWNLFIFNFLQFYLFVSCYRSKDSLNLMHYYYLFILILETNLLHLFLVLDSFNPMNFSVYKFDQFKYFFNSRYLDLFCFIFSKYLHFMFDCLLFQNFCLLTSHLFTGNQAYLISLTWNS